MLRFQPPPTSIDGFRRKIHEFKYPVGGDHGLLYGQVHLAQFFNRTVDFIEVAEISDQSSNSEGPGNHPSGGNDDDDNRARQHARIDDRGVEGLQFDGIDASVDDFCGSARETPGFKLFGAEGLHQTHPGEHLTGHRSHLAH